MNFTINPKTSDIVITLYAVITLFCRTKFESESGVGVLQSLVIGACLVALPWSLIKLKILNPDWFGLFTSKNSKP